jgi:S1-C subfamily serine protease
MLLRMLGYSEKANDFRPEDAPAFAQRIGLVSKSYSGNLTRGDLFESMAEALQFSYKDQDLTVLEKLIQTGTCSRYAANALGLLKKELTARQTADRHMSAVFCMDLYHTEDAVVGKTPSSNASGFFISSDGLAVTNYHSIEGSIYATATLCTGDVYEIERVIYYDKEIDIAVVRVSQTSTNNQSSSAFAYLDLAGTDDIRHGDTVYTLGNPLGLGLAVSSGIISDTARDVERYALPCVMNTADISQGSSGGALLNIYGQVIAVTSGAYTYGNNMYLAVPVDPVLTADLSVTGQTLTEVIETEAAQGS